MSAVTGYTVSRNGAVLARLGNVTSFSDATVAAKTLYSYSVTASDAAGNVSAASGAVSVTTPVPPDTTAPTAPTALMATAVSPTQVNLVWNAATDNVGVTGYTVSRNGAVLARLGNVTSFSDATVAAKTLYSYSVTASDAAGNVSAASGAVSVTTPVPPDTTAPTAPTALMATAVSPTQVNLVWNAATDNVGVTGYTVSRNGAVLARLGNVTSFSDATVAAKTLYSYSVTASDAAGNGSAASAASTVTTPAPVDTTPPSLPTSVSATATSGYAVNVIWKAATDNVAVTGYRISRNGVVVATVPGLSYVDIGVSPSTNYGYAVSAIDAAGNVGKAGTASTTTPADTAPLGSGFAASYFANTKLTGPAITRLDPTINFSWGTLSPVAGVPADHFSARWTGKLKAPNTGAYTFYTQADDNARLWVNGQLLINQWTGGPASASATISLTAGVSYNVRLEYVEQTAGATMKLSWSGPKIAKAIIPASVMSSGSDGLLGTYFANATLTDPSTLIRPDSNVNFNWGTAAPDPTLPADNFSVRWTGSVLPVTTTAYRFYTDSSGGGVRLWVNGQLVVNDWTIHGPTTDSGVINLTAGTSYTIRLEYQNVSGAATAALSWSTGTGAKTVIPATALRDR